MPLAGTGHSLNLVGDEAPYFTSLEELDSWMDKQSRKLRSVLPYTPRSRTVSPPEKGKLLVRLTNITLERQVWPLTHTQVCHDYKVKLVPGLRIVFSYELPSRGDTMRNPQRSHIHLISGRTARFLSSRYCVHQ